MPMTPEDVAELNDLRSTILSNTQRGLPAYHGIDQDRLKAAINKLREDRKNAGAETKKSGGGKKKAQSSVANLDPSDLFK